MVSDAENRMTSSIRRIPVMFRKWIVFFMDTSRWNDESVFVNNVFSDNGYTL